MGIPSYFKHVISKYKFILTEYKKDAKTIDNLYIDAQSLIYDAVKNNDGINKVIIEDVISRIGMYINTIGPSKKVYVAFDGVAPVAKMKQQRNRRYKGDIEKKILRRLGVSVDDTWNTTALTPGTAFMAELNAGVKKAFSNSSKYKVQKIIISASDKAGEGEHKIFEYIRNNASYHKSTTTAIYGLDADLIMLSLNHLRVADKLFLFRETPHFIKSIDSSLIADKNYMINIPLMAQAITKDLNDGKDIVNENQRQRMFDYIFICFFLGNDFMPHFPALNIRTNGIRRITAAYKETLSKSGNLTTPTGIIWKNVRVFVSILAADEERSFQDEHNIRNKQAVAAQNGRPGDDPKVSTLTNIPILDRVKEEYINPFEDGWKDRYYKTLLDCENSEQSSKLIATNYIEGLEWTFRYYTTGCPDWSWQYNYNYPPLLCDLKKHMPHFDQSFITNDKTVPVHSSVQLAYVLPPSCLHLLPDQIKDKLLSDKPEWYKETSLKIEYSYCRYFWEGHIITPHIDLEELKDIVLTY